MFTLHKRAGTHRSLISGQTATVCSGCRGASNAVWSSVAAAVDEGEGVYGCCFWISSSGTWNFKLKIEAPAEEMIIRLGRLTPGYFRLLQRQVSGEVRMQPQSSLITPIAMAMATVGTGVSLYSARQMLDRVHLKHPNAGWRSVRSTQ